MAKFISLLLFFFSIAFGYAQDSKLIASSCHTDGGRCSGNAYCTACSNCSGCKHCNSGGTCGVCTSYDEPVKAVYKKPAKKKVVHSGSALKQSANNKTAVKKASVKAIYAPSPAHSAGDKLNVISEILKLREGPGTDYPVIETLEKDDAVQLLGYDGEWLQVIVIKSKNVGYVKVMFLR